MTISQTSGFSIFLSKWRPNFDGQHGQDDSMRHRIKFGSFFNFRILMIGRVKRVKLLQDGRHRHLRFSKFQNCNGQNVQEGQTTSPCQISYRSVKPFRRYDDCLIFQDGGSC